MKTNDLKKGDTVILRNGWKADLMDNKKGTIRDAKVYGTFTEVGSIYAHDIVGYMDKDGNKQSDIELTQSQTKCWDYNRELGFGY